MKNLTTLGLLLAIVAGGLLVAPAMAEPYNLPKLAALAVGAAIAWFGAIRDGAASTPIDAPIAALFVSAAASTCVSADPAASVLGMYPQQFYGLLPLALCAALYYAAASWRDRDAADRVGTALVATGAAMSAFAIVQRIADRTIVADVDLPVGHRVSSTIGSPVMFGAFLVLMLPFALREAFERKTALGKSAVTAMLVALALTLTRGAWASAALACALYALAAGRVRPTRRHWRWLAGGLLAAAIPLYLVTVKWMSKSASDSMRVEMLKIAKPAIAARPWLGWGPDAYMIPFRRYKTDRWVALSHQTSVMQASAHNDLLESLITTGVFGFAAYAWLLVALFLAVRKRLADAPGDTFAAATAAALGGLFLQAKVNPVVPTALATLAIAVGVALRPTRPVGGRTRSALALAAALVCVATTAELLRLCRADALFKRGVNKINADKVVDAVFMDGVADMKRATELNPWSLDYMAQRCDLIFRVSHITPREQSKQLIAKTLELTAEGIRLHPGNATAHEMRSTALTLAAQLGEDTLREALAEIKTASEMDPTLTFSLRRRMDLARALNDRDEFERAKADYLRIIGLTNEAPDWNPIVL